MPCNFLCDIKQEREEGEKKAAQWVRRRPVKEVGSWRTI